MKILTIIDGFPPEQSGGSEHVALNVSRGLHAEGHEVVVITTTQRAADEGETIYEGLRVIRMFSAPKHQLALSYLGVHNPAIKSRFIRILKQERPDVVHFHNIHNHISYAAFAWARRHTTAKIFFTAHDVMSFAYSRLTHFIDPTNPNIKPPYDYRMNFSRLWYQAGRAYNPLRRIMIRGYLQHADRIFAVSDALKQAFLQNGIPNVETIYNGIDISRLEVSEDAVREFKTKHELQNKKVILFAGRAMSAKGLTPLLESLSLVVPRVPHVVLAVAIPSEGAYTDHIRRVVSEKDLGSHVQIIGLQKGSEWAAMFQASDVIAVPSIYFDPAPLVTMEAMAAKKPVIGTCFGGTPEIIEDGISGFIVNPYDRDMMAEDIVSILSGDSLAKTMGERGFERVSSLFTIRHQVQAILTAYERA